MPDLDARWLDTVCYYRRVTSAATTSPNQMAGKAMEGTYDRIRREVWGALLEEAVEEFVALFPTSLGGFAGE